MNKNKASIILSGISILGVATTGFLAAKRSELQKILKNEALKKNSNLTKKDEFIIFVKAQWPALLSGSATSACIIGAQVLDMKEIAAVSSIAMAATYKYNDAMNYIKEKYPDTYKEVKSYVNSESAKRAIESNPKVKEEAYDGKKRYYFPLSDQIVYMKPEDLIKVQSYISSTFGTKLEVYINEILDFIHQDLGYKDVHLCNTNYIWEFMEDDETMAVETYNFPSIELEYDDILDNDGSTVVCQVITMSFEPSNYS